MNNILILGKPGTGKTTFLTNLYGIYNEKHIFDRNPDMLKDFSILFDEEDSTSLKQNYKLIKKNESVQPTVAYQEFKCQLIEGKDLVIEFTLCDNKGGITRRLDWGGHTEWIQKLIDLIPNDTNGSGDDGYFFNAVVFFYDCNDFKESGEIYIDRPEIKKQLAVLDDVARNANKPVYIVFTKKDCITNEEINFIEDAFSDAQRTDSYINKIFLQINDATPKNRGKILVPIVYILRRLYLNGEHPNVELAEKLRYFGMRISNLN